MSGTEWQSEVSILIAHRADAAIGAFCRAGQLIVPKIMLPEQVSLDEPAAVVAAVREQLGLKITELFPLGEIVDEQAATVTAAVACEVRTGITDAAGIVWIGADRLEMLSDEDRGPARDALGTLSGEALRPGRAPWFARGWFAGAERWLRTVAKESGCEPTGQVEQFRTWSISSVLRVPTTCGMVYFKASADMPLFVNEALVTRALSSMFPEFVPAPLAIDAGRDWLALPDFGEAVSWDASLDVKIVIFRRFAQLQMASVEHVDRLLEAGCIDRRLDWLAREQKEWFTGPLARRLLSANEFSQLQSCSAWLPTLCADLASFGIPDALLHGDFHLGNAARNEHGYVFFDWTDAAVSHPFLDMISIVLEDDVGAAQAARAAYLAEWAAICDPESVQSAWDLAVVLMAANHAISYLSLSSNIDSPRHDMAEVGVCWLRRLLSGASELAARRGANDSEAWADPA
jgi:Phosphotransferase enzyme family